MVFSAAGLRRPYPVYSCLAKVGVELREFEGLGLREELLRAIADAGYAAPTPVQRRAIPVALEGRDVLACAQTGTGKTAAFALPILQRLARGGHAGLRALVLTPTRELAAQVGESFQVYGKHLALRTATVFGGVGMEPQIRQLRRGVDILVATPGRLLDLMGRGHVNLSRLEVLVLDEADRMLDMGFIPDVRRILRAVPPRRQTLFFSATMPSEIQVLAEDVLRDPEIIEVGRRARPAEGVRQVVHPVDRSRKRALLVHLLRERRMERVIVFTRTKHAADRLAERLAREGWRVEALHSNKSQKARQKALDAFRTGAVQVLVATDIASRGLDVEGVSHVVNYDLPGAAEDYVHRIGRTARAQATGDAITFAEPGESEMLYEIEKLIDMELPVEVVRGFELGAAAGDAPRESTRVALPAARAEGAPSPAGAPRPAGSRPGAPRRRRRRRIAAGR